MPRNIFHRSAVDVLNDAAKNLWAMAAVDTPEARAQALKIRQDAAHDILYNEHVLGYLNSALTSRGQYATQQEINILSRAIDIQTRITLDKMQKPKRPLFFFDLFQANGLIKPTEISNTIRALKKWDWNYGDVQFISDMTDDLPTQAADSDSVTGVRVHPIGNSVRVGLIEMRDALREGEDLIQTGITKQFESIRAFANEMIATGAPLKSMFGLLNNPALSANTFTVAPSAVNPPFTEWSKKSQTEIIADLAAIKQFGFTESDQIRYPNQFIVAKDAFDVLTLTQMPNQSGQFVISAWNASQALDTTAEPMTVTPSLAFNGAASDGVSNMGLAGDFSPEVLEMFFAAPEVLPTQNHGLHFHVPIISAISGVNVRQPEYLVKWEGM